MTRQAYYKHQHATQRRLLHEEIIVAAVLEIRERQPMLGGRKLHHLLSKKFADSELAMGRDQLYNLLRERKLLVPQRRNYRRTTQSYHRFRVYTNLIRDLVIHRILQVVVADITYIHTLEGFCYLALLTDACSRKIVGYDLSRSLSIEGSLRALQMMLQQAKPAASVGLIHHSDRGIQYCSDAYVELLHQHGAQISMTEEQHVYENAKAERVNGILKTEFMLGQKLSSFAVAKELVDESIYIYNHERPHLSLNYQTPAIRHAA